MSRTSKVTPAISKQIRKLLDKGWTQKDISAKFGISQSYVSRLFGNTGTRGRVQDSL